MNVSPCEPHVMARPSIVRHNIHHINLCNIILVFVITGCASNSAHHTPSSTPRRSSSDYKDAFGVSFQEGHTKIISIHALIESGYLSFWDEENPNTPSGERIDKMLSNERLSIRNGRIVIGRTRLLGIYTVGSPEYQELSHRIASHHTINRPDFGDKVSLSENYTDEIFIRDIESLHLKVSHTLIRTANDQIFFTYSLMNDTDERLYSKTQTYRKDKFSSRPLHTHRSIPNRSMFNRLLYRILKINSDILDTVTGNPIVSGRPTDQEENEGSNQNLISSQVTEDFPLPRAENPSESVYMVQAGDTLDGIARKHGTTVTSLREINNLTRNTLLVGQILRLDPPIQSTLSHESPPARKYLIQGQALESMLRERR